jgi:hypothetical protein
VVKFFAFYFGQIHRILNHRRIFQLNPKKPRRRTDMLTSNKANLRRPQQILPPFRPINRIRQGIVSVAMATHEIRRITLPQSWKQPGHGQSAVSPTLAHANRIRFFMEMITPPLGLWVF